MSGPKVGVVALGGATAVGVGGGVALAAAAVVASPVVFTGLIVAAAIADSHQKKKTAKTTKRGAEKFLNSYQQERNNMIAEIDRSEKPLQSLLANGETRWNTLKHDLDQIRREVQTEMNQLRNNTGMPQTKSEAENSLRQAEKLLNDAEYQREQFVQFRNESNQSFRLARNNPSAAKRTVRQHIAQSVMS